MPTIDDVFTFNSAHLEFKHAMSTMRACKDLMDRFPEDADIVNWALDRMTQEREKQKQAEAFRKIVVPNV